MTIDVDLLRKAKPESVSRLAKSLGVLDGPRLVERVFGELRWRAKLDALRNRRA